MASKRKRDSKEDAPVAGSPFDETDMLCVNTLRCFGAELPNLANSGHPGAPMGMAPMAHVLFTRFLKCAPSQPFWEARDRFVLSNGHACALLYSLLHLLGYEEFASVDVLRQFRTVGSKTPGHPESWHEGKRVGGVEVTTGPLGQGIANAVGMAAAALHLSATNKRENGLGRVYVFAGDGCLQEGVASEAASLAGHLGLHNLVVLYDDNKITIDGPTDLSFSEDVGKRFEAYGWNVLTVNNGDTGLAEIDRALRLATASSGGRGSPPKPWLIKVRTTIGLHAKLAGTQKVHGSPIGAEDLAKVKTELGLDPAKELWAPDAVRDRYAAVAARGNAAAAAAAEPSAGNSIPVSLPSDWMDALKKAGEQLCAESKTAAKAQATRQSSAAVLTALTKAIPTLVGGSADLTPSTLTLSEAAGGDFQWRTPGGRYFRFGVREHGMAAFCNGLFAFQPGALVPFCATFFNFVQYLLPALRLSAISHFGVIYVMTHDSIGLGEDGPTHQPVGALAQCRSIPNVLVLRPADAAETVGAYQLAVMHRTMPSVICLTRQGVPQLDQTSADQVAKGAYVVHPAASSDAKVDLVLVGSGSETQLCVEAAKRFNGRAQAVSMPCWSLFDQQPRDYRRSVFPADAVVLSVEAGATLGWSRYAHHHVGVDRFGLSGPVKDVMSALGFTVDNVYDQAEKLINFYKGRSIPDLLDRLE